MRKAELSVICYCYCWLSSVFAYALVHYRALLKDEWQNNIQSKIQTEPEQSKAMSVLFKIITIHSNRRQN